VQFVLVLLVVPLLVGVAQEVEVHRPLTLADLSSAGLLVTLEVLAG
jgi:hypothetical protein